MKTIIIIYHSQQKGNTRRLAELVAQGCRKVEGVGVELVNTNETRLSIDDAERADAYAIGSGDYFGYVNGGIKQFFDDIVLASWGGKKTVNKPCVLFLTHGGGGQAIESLRKLASAAKLTQVSEDVSCENAPESQQDIDRAIQLGVALAEHVAKA